MNIYDNIDFIYSVENVISNKEFSEEGFNFKPSKKIYKNKNEVFSSKELKESIIKIKEYANKKKYEIMKETDIKKLIKAEVEELGGSITTTKEFNLSIINVNQVPIIVCDINFSPTSNTIDNIGNVMPIIGFLKKIFKVDKHFKIKSQEKFKKQGIRVLMLSVYFETKKVDKIVKAINDRNKRKTPTMKMTKFIGEVKYSIK